MMGDLCSVVLHHWSSGWAGLQDGMVFIPKFCCSSVRTRAKIKLHTHHGEGLIIVMVMNGRDSTMQLVNPEEEVGGEMRGLTMLLWGVARFLCVRLHWVDQIDVQ